MAKATQRYQVRFRLSTRERHELDELCKRLSMHRADFVRAALRDYIRKARGAAKH